MKMEQKPAVLQTEKESKKYKEVLQIWVTVFYNSIFGRGTKVCPKLTDPANYEAITATASHHPIL